MTKQRSKRQKALDFITFPIRAFTLFHQDRWGLSSLASERYDFAAGEVIGACLDVGCGRHNRFIDEYLNGNGSGIDIYPYDGLRAEHIVEDLSNFPFDNHSFHSVSFLANINHVPKPLRDRELAEAYRVLKNRGNIIITMGHPLAEILVHLVVRLYDRLFKTNFDMDTERGMQEDEEYFLTDREIIQRLQLAGFKHIQKKCFWTQWGFNHLFVGWKE